MAKKIFFTVGPSAIYPSVVQWTNDFYQKGYASEYHRSSVFQSIYRHLDEQLRVLMEIPDTHAILIASSGSEIMERILQNCVQSSSFHFVNGSFSKKFFDYALRLGIQAEKCEIDFGNGFDYIPTISATNELICITHNETSTGIKTPESFIHQVKQTYPNQILAVDTVSSAPLVNLDFSLVDMCFFSSQKAFGLPAGLGIWIVRKDLANTLVRTKVIGIKAAHNTLADYLKNYESFQTPSTPNTLGVYLMGKVAEDMNKIGREKLFDTMNKNKKKFQSLFSNSPYLRQVNTSEITGSDTVIVTEFLKEKQDVIGLLAAHNIICSSGYGSFKDSQLRFSNFPANSPNSINYLAKVLSL
jgi:phosphoserine aminotransferase